MLIWYFIVNVLVQQNLYYRVYVLEFDFGESKMAKNVSNSDFNYQKLICFYSILLRTVRLVRFGNLA